MTLEEIGADFLTSIIKMDLCGWSTLKGAASYLRNERSPFVELCRNPNNVNIRKIYDKMGLSDEQIEKLKCVLEDEIKDVFSKDAKEPEEEP